MNVQAAFKTLAIVLAIGALTGYAEWRKTDGAPPEVRAARELWQCTHDRQTAAFRANPLTFGHNVTQQNQRFEAECRAQQRNGLQLGVSAAPIDPAASSTEVGGLHYTPTGQVQTQSREQCLAQLDDARKRSPHGLNPAYEQRQRGRCADLYSDPAAN